jgi:FkbM family methyltransferase
MALTSIDPDLVHRADLRPGDEVWDVGASAGRGAGEIRRLHGVVVHAFEPHPGAFARLEEATRDDPGIVPHRYALGRRDGTASLSLEGPGSSLFGSGEDACEIEVRDVVGVFDELVEDRLAYVKINIEGGEYDLLERMVETGLVERTRYLLIQFHEWYPRAHLRRWRLRRALRRTHDQVWSYPWIWELWCLRSDPPPPPMEVTDELRRAVVAEMEARRAAAGGAQGT